MTFNFSYTFFPRKLLEAESEIKRAHHKINAELKIDGIDTNRLRNLLNKIKELDKNEIPRFSYELSKEDLYLLADYMPRNSYDVDLDKIYEILKIRFRDDFISIFYSGFQNHYYNTNFNNYFRKFLKLTNKSHAVLGISIEAINQFINWLSESNVIDKIVNSYFSSNTDFDSYMKYFGFLPSKKLYEDCIRYLYTCCSAKFYLEANIEELINIIKGYNHKEIIKFINNYLLRMEVDDFQDEILNYIHLKYGDIDEKNYIYIWNNIYEEAKQKYSIWIAQKQMDKFFKGDARYMFWVNFIKDVTAKLMAVNDKQLFLDFGKFIVVEFKEINNAAYIYSKDVFNKYFLDYANKKDVYDNSVFKNPSLMFISNKIIHSGNWQYRTNKLINKLIKYFK